jgi:TolA-binding protein
LGRKRTGKRKYIYGVLTALIVSVVLGCATVKTDRFSADLQSAADLYARGDFENSLKANQGIISRSGHQEPADQALFNMGLIYASQNNPRKDYRRSRAQFQKIIREYPESPLVAQSKTWVGVLSVIERSKEADIEVEETKKKLAR